MMTGAERNRVQSHMIRHSLRIANGYLANKLKSNDAYSSLVAVDDSKTAYIAPLAQLNRRAQLLGTSSLQSLTKLNYHYKHKLFIPWSLWAHRNSHKSAIFLPKEGLDTALL